ncbi:hypothetical protein V498_08346 [Pseudogymnoascus sp. VKM F-4517 (FW-2822)]|nr:hypothetical protein V498_08346 [Pseudogymnoascus sp. VKM F-4517 (FW-2822)]
MVARFRIALDPPYPMADQKAHHYLPGDPISGKVIFAAKDGENIKSISVTFKGSLYTKATQRHLEGTYNVDIFKLSATLLQGPFKMTASTYEYPFVFEIPRGFTSPLEWSGSSTPTDLYSIPPGSMWPTPPTCDDALQLRDTYTNWSITYSLSARGEKSMFGLSDELPIVVTASRPSLNPGPGYLRQDARDGFKQNYAFTNEGIPRALTKTESFKGTMQQNANNYQLNLSLLAAPATAIIIGQPFTIAFTLQTDTPTSNYRLPEFYLRDYTIALCSSTAVWTPYNKGKSYLGTTALHPFEIFPSKRTINAPLRFNEPVMMQETLPSSFKSTPSFKTQLFERRYYFQIHAHVSCFDNTVKLKILLPFWLHSPKVQG